MARLQARAISQVMAACAAKLGRRGRNQAYSRTQWALLRYIADPQTAAPTAREFAARHGVIKSTMTRMIERLCRANVIHRDDHPHDQRARRLSLTPKGRKALKADPLRDLASALAAKFTLEEIDAFARAIDALASRPSKWIAEECPLCADARARLAMLDNTSALKRPSAQARGRKSSGADQLNERAFAVLHAFAIMAPRFDFEGASGELSPSEWTALRFFAMVNRQAATLPAYANHHAVTVSSASYIVTSLSDKGLVAYEENPDNKRSFRVAVTEAGRSKLRRDPLLKIATILEKALDEDELALIGRIMRAILLYWGDPEKSQTAHSPSFPANARAKVARSSSSVKGS